MQRISLQTEPLDLHLLYKLNPFDLQRMFLQIDQFLERLREREKERDGGEDEVDTIIREGGTVVGEEDQIYERERAEREET